MSSDERASAGRGPRTAERASRPPRAMALGPSRFSILAACALALALAEPATGARPSPLLAETPLLETPGVVLRHRGGSFVGGVSRADGTKARNPRPLVGVVAPTGNTEVSSLLQANSALLTQLKAMAPDMTEMSLLRFAIGFPDASDDSSAAPQLAGFCITALQFN